MTKSVIFYSVIVLLLLASGCSQCSNGKKSSEMHTGTQEEPSDSSKYIRATPQWGFIDTLGRLQISGHFEDADHFSENMAAVKQQNMWGFINTYGEIVIPCTFKGTWAFREGIARVLNKDDKIGFIDKKGRFLIPPVYENASDFHEGKAVAETERGLIYIDRKGKKALEGYFEQASDFENGIAKVKLLGKFGIIKTDGSWLLKPKYQHINVQPNGYLVCILRDKGVVFNYRGQQQANLKNCMVLHYHPKSILCEKDGVQRLTDRKNRIRSDSTFEEITPFGDTIWQVRSGNYYGLLSCSGKLLIPIQFRQLYRISENRIAFRHGDLWGFMDEQLNIIVKPIYNLAWSFQGGFARVTDQKGFGYLNWRGELISAQRYKDARDFSEGLARVRLR